GGIPSDLWLFYPLKGRDSETRRRGDAENHPAKQEEIFFEESSIPHINEAGRADRLGEVVQLRNMGAGAGEGRKFTMKSMKAMKGEKISHLLPAFPSCSSCPSWFNIFAAFC